MAALNQEFQKIFFVPKWLLWKGYYLTQKLQQDVGKL